jgi:O-antigen ligase
MSPLNGWRERAGQALQPLNARLARYVGPMAQACTVLVAVLGGLWLGRMIVKGKGPSTAGTMALGLNALLCVTNPVLALLVWLVLSPFARFAYLNKQLAHSVPDLTLDRVVIMLLITLVLVQIATGQRKVARFDLVDAAGLLVVVLMGISVGTSLLGRIAAIQSCFDTFAMPFLVYWVAKNLITNRNDMRGAMIALLLVGAYMAFLAAHEQLTGVNWFFMDDRLLVYSKDVRRVVALLGNPAYLAACINAATPFVAYLFVTSRSRLAKLFYLGLIVLFGAGVFLCYNRSGWVGFVLTFVVMALFSPKMRRYVVPAMAVAGLVVLVAGAALLADRRIAERLLAQGPIEYRTSVMAVVLRMLKDHLWMGVGYFNFPFYYTRYDYWDPMLRALPAPHNSFAYVAITAGGPAAILYLLFFVFYFVQTFRLYLKAGNDTFPDRSMIGAAWGAILANLAAAMVMDLNMGIYATMFLNFIMGMTLGAWQNKVVPLPRPKTK